ncbi:MAG: hypothetical protein IPM02_08125 [Betaproteobacteria bacterium]|nr:hypothetical protein [Betaproteobacteria bacterium]
MTTDTGEKVLETLLIGHMTGNGRSRRRAETERREAAALRRHRLPAGSAQDHHRDELELEED